MKIISPKVEILSGLNKDEVLKLIEQAARNCYHSEDKITKDSESAKKIITMLMSKHHDAMLEFADITVKLTCDIGVYKDLTRHRHCSFAIESTRYCNYSKDKFGNEITFIEPCNIEKYDNTTLRDVSFTEPFYTKEYRLWYDTMQIIEDSYIRMSKFGAKPDQLRLLLPHSTAASVVMKANIREWRHILKLRTSPAAHPSVQEIMKMVLHMFKFNYPILFDDIGD